MKNFETEIPFFYSFNFIKIFFYLIKLFKKKKLIFIKHFGIKILLKFKKNDG